MFDGWLLSPCVSLLGQAAPAVDGSARLDAALVQFHQASGITPAAPADDATFLRRVWLDVAGRTPPVAEVRKFLASKDPDKRHVLIDELLASQHAANHFGRRWTEYLTDRRPFEQPEYNGRDRAELSARRLAGKEGLPHRGRRAFGRRRWQRYERAGQFPAALQCPAHAAGRSGQQEVPRPDDAVRRMPRSSVRVSGSGAEFWGLAAYFGRLRRMQPVEVPAGDQEQQAFVLVVERGTGELRIPDLEAKPDEQRQSAVQSRLSAASRSGRSGGQSIPRQPSAVASR